MRILLMNRAFPPDVEATGQYVSELAEDLSARHEVHVLCGMPNFGRVEGRAFPWRRERHGAVNVWRAWNLVLPKRLKVARMANQASFFVLAHAVAGRIPRPDVVVSYTDPPFLGLLALRLKRRRGIPFVYYCQDLYPDVLEAIDMAPPVLTQGFRWVQRRLLAGSDLIIALGEDMKERIRSKGVPESKIEVVRNWVDTDAIYPIPRDRNPFRKEHDLDGRFVVMYSGNFGHVWDLDTVLDAAAMLRDRKDIVFVLIGDGSTRPRIERRVRDEALTNVRLLPYQPKERLSESLSAADLHVVPIRPGVCGTVVPSKIYAILASGVPMVVLAEEASEPIRVVEEWRCGWSAVAGDASTLCRSLLAARRDGGETRARGERGRRAAVDHHGRLHQFDRFGTVLRGLAGPSAAGQQPDGLSERPLALLRQASRRG